MFTTYTYQDWLAESPGKRVEKLKTIIGSYTASPEFKRALEAQSYFRGENTSVAMKTISQAHAVETKDESGRTRKKTALQEIAGNRIASNFLFRFVTQQNQMLLGNGVTLDSTDMKKRLGYGFDHAMEQAGENALLHGVCWGFWNVDHLEVIPAASDAQSGFVALLDERTGDAMVGLHFWRLDSSRPLYVRVFEVDGITEYREAKDGLVEVQSKQAYRQTVRRDNAGEEVTRQENYDRLPVIPLFANSEQRSEFTTSIKSKIDAYDRILSDFADNLDRANDVYWVLNNFGGTTDDIAEMLAEISRIRAVANFSDGTGSSSTAEPHTIEVPYAARQKALEILEKALYQDYMALSMDELTGGSLTNVAIEAARTNLNLKCDRYEWQCFRFVQQVLALIGVQTERIVFKRQEIVNKSEIVTDIYAMRGDIDHRTALKLNPYIQQEEIDQIVDDVAAEAVSGKPSVDDLQRMLNGGGA